MSIEVHFRGLKYLDSYQMNSYTVWFCAGFHGAPDHTPFFVLERHLNCLELL